MVSQESAAAFLIFRCCSPRSRNMNLRAFRFKNGVAMIFMALMMTHTRRSRNASYNPAGPSKTFLRPARTRADPNACLLMDPWAASASMMAFMILLARSDEFANCSLVLFMACCAADRRRSRGLIGRRPTARPSASFNQPCASGHTAEHTRTRRNAQRLWPTGNTATTGTARTAASAVSLPWIDSTSQVFWANKVVNTGPAFMRVFMGDADK